MDKSPLRLWDESRARIKTLTSQRAPEAPKGTSRDVLAHLVGMHADTLGGTRDPHHTDSWAWHHVHDRHATSLTDLHQEWEEYQAGTRELLETGHEGARDILTETITHEQDLKYLLQDQGPSSLEALWYALDTYTPVLGDHLDHQGLGSITFCTLEKETTAGMGAHQGSVMVTTQALHKALTGRAGPDEVRRWGWDTNPEPYLHELRVLGDPLKVREALDTMPPTKKTAR